MDKKQIWLVGVAFGVDTFCWRVRVNANAVGSNPAYLISKDCICSLFYLINFSEMTKLNSPMMQLKKDRFTPILSLYHIPDSIVFKFHSHPCSFSPS